jgi:AraC-like DNA-binding protein
LIGRELADGERPGLAAVARRVGVAPRTLQRRLSELGWSFAELVDDVRRTTASRLLADASLSRGELAQLLGYRDSSALNKGLRRIGLGADPGARGPK